MELAERMWPERIRDRRADPDDGVENYLTMAEEIARAPFVEVTKEKIRMLETAKDLVERFENAELEESEDYDDD